MQSSGNQGMQERQLQQRKNKELGYKRGRARESFVLLPKWGVKSPSEKQEFNYIIGFVCNGNYLNKVSKVKKDIHTWLQIISCWVIKVF